MKIIILEFFFFFCWEKAHSIFLSGNSSGEGDLGDLQTFL